MTPEQYQQILPYKGAIRDRSCSGTTGRELADIRIQWSGVHTNLHCNSCAGQMFDYFDNLIFEYEQANKQNP